MERDVLKNIAKKIMQKGKGILAADESTNTIQKRFDSIGIENTEIHRCQYRNILFSNSHAMQNYISGVILFDETIRQTTQDGRKLTDIILANNSIPGIKVDQGLKPIDGSKYETITSGLEGLDARCKEYHALGARFAKWRAVIHINQESQAPHAHIIKDNMQTLAQYAICAQRNHIVPIVEPEILMDGTHDINTCYDVTSHVLKSLFEELAHENVLLEGMILKPNMVIPALECPAQVSRKDVAEKTLTCLIENVPQDVAGIAFLSGGQSEIEATAHLNSINQLAKDKAIKTLWPISFSYGRALQTSVLKTWLGKNENYNIAQNAFTHRARMNSLASQGMWQDQLET